MVAAADAPVTPSQVQAELARATGQELAYTTVMTTLARLHDKGALDRTNAGRAFAYGLAAEPAELSAALTARQMQRLLDAQDDRAAALTRFVAALSPEDEAVLTSLLQDHPAPGDPGAAARPSPPPAQPSEEAKPR